VVFAALALAGAGARAEAHALLASSVPAAGALVDTPPPSVTLSFTETPDPALSIVHVLDSRGAPVERGKAHSVAGQRDTLAVDVPRLGNGVYTVTWRTTSSVDGHSTGGSFSFGVGVAPSKAATTAGAPRTPRPSPLAVFGRWAFYAGLVTLVGAGTTTVFVTRRPPAAPRWWPLAAGGAAAVGLVAMGFDLLDKAGVPVGELLRSATGHKLALQAGALAVVLVAAVIATARPSRPAVIAVAAAASVAMLARAATGPARGSSVPWLQIGVQWVHLAAVGAWIGGFGWLLVALRAATDDGRWDVARRFSRLAAWALLAVAVSGTVRAFDEVGAWSRVVHTSFGQVLAFKVGLVAIVVALGARNRFRHLRPAAADDAPLERLRRAVGAELVLGATVLLATAILAGLPPSKSVAVSTRAVPHVTVIGHDYATSIRAELKVTPGVIGFNQFELRLRDYDRQRPIDATAVTLTLQAVDRPDVPAASVAVTGAGSGLWRGEGTVLAFAGQWRVTVLVERPSGAVTVPLVLRVPSPPQRVSAVRTPGLPTIYTITTGGGQNVQAYIDPGRPGANEVHVTFLDSAGAEVPTSAVVLTARRGTGARSVLTVRQLGPGHFVGDASLRSGTWTFSFRATAEGGALISGSFSEKIGR
jgi:copper transport protein